MSNNEHTITPPPELVQQWAQMTAKNDIVLGNWVYIATQAARWGADQELEACINYFHDYDTSWGEDSDLIAGLRATRRPQPPNLKQQALAKLGAMERLWESAGNSPSDLVRRALEALPDD
jgi:hypothetical protein